MNTEEQKLNEIDIEEKISVTSGSGKRVAARKFLEQSCELAKGLPPHKRILFVMHYSHGFSHEEIADVCNCSVHKVSMQLQKITIELNAMRNCMKGIEENGEVNESTKMRIERYFREQADRRRGQRKLKNLDEGI